MNRVWTFGFGVLLLQMGMGKGAVLQKRWIPARMSDYDYGFDTSNQQNPIDDGPGYQQNYMNYNNDFFTGGYLGGDYSGMMFRAGQSPAPSYATMDPVQQLQNVQAYSYAQQLQQHYPNGVPLPYPPQYNSYQQQGEAATGRALLNLNLLQTTPNNFENTRFQMVQNQRPATVLATSSHSNAMTKDALLAHLIKQKAEQEPESFIVEQTAEEPQVEDTAIQPEEAAIQPEEAAFQPEEAAFQPEEASFQPEDTALEPEDTAEEFEVEPQQVQSHGLLANQHAFPSSKTQFNKLSHEASSSHNTAVKHLPTHQTNAQVLAEEIEVLQNQLESQQAKETEADEDAGEVAAEKTHAKKQNKIKNSKGFKTANTHAGRARGYSSDVDPNVYANYGENSGLVDTVVSPLDSVYPGAMVPVQSRPPIQPAYYPQSPYSFPQQMYQPSPYGPAPGTYSIPYSGYSYPAMPSYYNTQSGLRTTRKSALLPMPVVVKYVYGAVPATFAHSGKY